MSRTTGWLTALNGIIPEVALGSNSIGNQVNSENHRHDCKRPSEPGRPRRSLALNLQAARKIWPATSLEDLATACRVMDVVVIAMSNYGNSPRGVGMVPLTTIESPNLAFLTIQNLREHAGFYFSPGNRFPFVFGNMPADKFRVLQVIGNASMPAARSDHRLGDLSLGKEKARGNQDKNPK